MLASRVIAMLQVKPRWLDGVTWRLVGMSALAGAAINSGNYWMHLPGDPGSAIARVLAQSFTGLLILFIGAAMLDMRRPRLPRSLSLFIAVVAGSLIGQGLLAYICILFYSGYRSAEDVYSFVRLTAYFGRQEALPWGFVVAAWYFAQRSRERTAALHERELGRQRLESRMAESRLAVMQAQVEPHFLFNTLAHIKRLGHTDSALARRMLDSLCDYLRAALPQMRGNTATLGSELDLASAYLQIQRIRMGRRLGVGIAVPAALRGIAFPPMMLISLVENSVKHGLSPLAEGGTIHIQAVARDSTLHVSVADTGQGFIKSSGTGIGLANISSRLAALHGRAAALSVAPNAPHGAVFTITLPVAPSGALA
jgi:signal transduction histidine kinase